MLEDQVRLKFSIVFCISTNSLFAAEKFLEGVEVNQNYPLLLLNLVHKPEADMTIRVAGAVAFKNYIKRNWFVVGIRWVFSTSLFVKNDCVFRRKIKQIVYMQLIV